MIRRVYVEKREGFDVKAQDLRREIKEILNIDCSLRFFIRYDFEGENADFEKSLNVVFSEPPADRYYLDKIDVSGRLLCVEFLPGQYDQRADSAAQCVSMLTGGERPLVRCATVYAFQGLDEAQFEKIRQYLINPVESRQCDDAKYETLKQDYPEPPPEQSVSGFILLDDKGLERFYSQNGFALSLQDLKFIQMYFKQEKREPFWTELKVLDTYWSDHCRHTTFNAELTEVVVNSEIETIKTVNDQYSKIFDKHFGERKKSGEKYNSLMNMATIAGRELKSRGLTPHIDESEEINACSIKIKADADGQEQDWTVMFKNETHNHPTEIEPFGGAATCLGGCIRDPLSGRAYVYQSMRICGAADTNAPLSRTLEGKLPQRVLSKRAAQGFSSYGNQIGLATGMVNEIYHPGYAAKRLEAGFCVGATKSENIVREKPDAGDAVLLIGGKTGRDGCGGATGSSKAHDLSSLSSCGAEVQKGDPITERKLQRLFRNPDFSRLVKRCNDFGAGGVSVAVGELADGLDIDLDKVPKKYTGLSGTELAIAESQERMAVVVSPSNIELAIKLCEEENLDAIKIADVTDSGSLRMSFKGRIIVDLKRTFLDSNGVRQAAKAEITDKNAAAYFNSIGGTSRMNKKDCGKYFDKKDYQTLLGVLLSDYNSASKKGMIELFDSTIGAGTILMPLGGKTQLSPQCAMAAALPMSCKTTTATVAAYDFDPFLSEISPFTAAVYATTNAIIKTAVSGADYDGIYLTNQEFFEKLRGEPKRWGKPASALLGSMHAQLSMERPAIGGKDSMSGSFQSLDVPPTLISFALGVGDARFIIGGAATRADINVYRYKIKKDGCGMPNFEELKRFLRGYQAILKDKKIDFVCVAGAEGAAATLVKALFGFELGFDFKEDKSDLFTPANGDVIFGIKKETEGFAEVLGLCEPLGHTTADGVVLLGGQKIALSALRDEFVGTFENNYPTTAADNGKSLKNDSKTGIGDEKFGGNSAKIKDYHGGSLITRQARIVKPRVFIPVFPGTNCEYDSANAFEKAGALVDVLIIKNRSAAQIEESVQAIKKGLKNANILMLPGGFSGGDEPDGSGKFICSMLQNSGITEEINNLLYKRDGLALGICNGFQALIKLGLLPYGRIAPLKEDSPTLTFNLINRHVSQIVRIRVSSCLSPWLSAVKVGSVFNQAVSHGEGRFVANDIHLGTLIEAGQIATQYVDAEGCATMVSPFNPNGSLLAAEGITSPDGRIFGKMGHSERVGRYLYKNLDDTPFDLKIFESGVKYFK